MSLSSLPPIEPHHDRMVHHPNMLAPTNNGNINIPIGSDEATNRMDIYGAVMRRKFIVVLLAIIGSGLGYLYYNSQDSVFSSSLQLVIWSQTPQGVVEGESIIRVNSIPKHQNLIISEVVLRKALDEGTIVDFDSLSASGYPVGDMKKMLSVHQVDDSDDTLKVSARGRFADELPVILSQVVAAYEEILDEDSRAHGKESIELIEKLQTQILGDLDKAETKYVNLVKGLGVALNNEGGDFVNPYADRYNELRIERDRLSRDLVDVNDKIRLLRLAIESRKDGEIAVSAIEGRKYLGMIDANRLERINNPIDNRLQAKIDSYEQKVLELQFAKRDLASKFGPKSPRMKSIADEVVFWQAQVNLLKKEELRFENLNSDLSDKVDTKNKQELQWISLYSVALERDRKRIGNLIEITDGELSQISDEATQVSGDVAEINVLRKQIEEKRTASRLILAKLSETNVLSNDYNKFKIRTFDYPKIGEKIAPSLAKNLALGIFLGGLLGVGLALLVDKLDMSFRTPTEIFGKLGVPVVGRIPRIRHAAAGPGGSAISPALVTIHKPDSVAAETFRAARTSIFFSMNTNGYKSFLVTSPMPGDGKSTIACNLAVSIAQAGKRTLLVDADFRKPRVHQYLGESLSPGITEALSGEVELSEATRSSLQENLDVLTTGHRPHNPGELVTSKHFQELINAVKAKYDVVIIDSPPLLPVADATVISNYVDGVYLAMRIRKGIKMAAQRARENLIGVKANLLGVIVNGMDENPHYHEYGYYGYGQYSKYGPYGYGKSPYSESPEQQNIAATTR